MGNTHPPLTTPPLLYISCAFALLCASGDDVPLDRAEHRRVAGIYHDAHCAAPTFFLSQQVHSHPRAAQKLFKRRRSYSGPQSNAHDNASLLLFSSFPVHYAQVVQFGKHISETTLKQRLHVHKQIVTCLCAVDANTLWTGWYTPPSSHTDVCISHLPMTARSTYTRMHRG